MKKFIMVAFGCLAASAFVASALAAEPVVAEPLAAAREKLEEGGRSLFAANDGEAALARYAEAEAAARRAAESPERSRLLAEIWLARGELFEIEGRKDDANDKFTRAHEIAEALYRARPGDPDALRVSADALMRLLPYRFLPFKARYGFEPRDRALEALRRSPDNRDALFSLGLYYYFCPALFGGSKEEARLYFAEYAKYATEGLARFKAAMWLAMANRDLGRVDESARAFSVADGIYPNSDWLKAERAKGKKGREGRK